uniref:Uncharacterized protein n=1 Tax=Arcella intermedia TaxID=1963864 RepID=A0A6B2LU09_9EUKA
MTITKCCPFSICITHYNFVTSCISNNNASIRTDCNIPRVRDLWRFLNKISISFKNLNLTVFPISNNNISFVINCDTTRSI